MGRKLSRLHWDQLRDYEKMRILALPDHDKLKQRFMNQMRYVAPVKPTPSDENTDSGMITRKAKNHRVKRSRPMPGNAIHTSVTTTRQDHLSLAESQPDPISRKKQKSFCYSPQYGNTCTVDGTPLTMLPDQNVTRSTIHSELRQKREIIHAKQYCAEALEYDGFFD